MLKSSHLQRMCDYSNMGVLWHIYLNHFKEMCVVWRVLVACHPGCAIVRFSCMSPCRRFDIQTAFRARMNIFKSGISGSERNRDSASGVAIRRVVTDATFQLLSSFVIILQTCYKKIAAIEKRQSMSGYYLL
jgi:hypothetical protein